MLPNIYICKYINTHIDACTHCTHSHQQLCDGGNIMTNYEVYEGQQCVSSVNQECTRKL